MRKAPVPPASTPPLPFRRQPQSSTCRDNGPKQEPYFFAEDDELHLAPPSEEGKALARSALRRSAFATRPRTQPPRAAARGCIQWLLDIGPAGRTLLVPV
jgi:hypothetical protein